MNIIIAVAAYLIGSLSFAVIISQLSGLADPRTYGSHNPGATNILRSGKKIAALLTLLGDGLKGCVAVWLAQKYGNGQNIVAIAALLVFAGHLWPVFFGFKGGKGVATALGILLAIDSRLGLATMGVWILMACIFRYSSLSAVTAAVFSVCCYAYLSGIDYLFYALIILNLLLIYRHRQNLRNLITGTESRLGKTK